MRVDEVVIRNRDTRIFWGLEGDKVFKDVTWKEENWEDLKVKEVRKWCGGEEEVRFFRVLRALTLLLTFVFAEEFNEY